MFADWILAFSFSILFFNYEYGENKNKYLLGQRQFCVRNNKEKTKKNMRKRKRENARSARGSNNENLHEKDFETLKYSAESVAGNKNFPN